MCDNCADADNRYLRENWHRQSAREIGRIVGRTRNAVIGRAWRMGLPGGSGKPGAPCKWTPEEVALLRECWALGLRPYQIEARFKARALRRGQRDISNKAHVLGLPARQQIWRKGTVTRISRKVASAPRPCRAKKLPGPAAVKKAPPVKIDPNNPASLAAAACLASADAAQWRRDAWRSVRSL